MEKFDFKYCMKYECNGCVKRRKCDFNDFKKKNKNISKRAKKKEKKRCYSRNTLHKDR